MDEAGNTKDDLSLPSGTDDASKLADQLKTDFEGGKELVVTVLKVLLQRRCSIAQLQFLVARCLWNLAAQLQQRLPLHTVRLALQESRGPPYCNILLPVWQLTGVCCHRLWARR